MNSQLSECIDHGHSFTQLKDTRVTVMGSPYESFTRILYCTKCGELIDIDRVYATNAQQIERSVQA
jgi:hypothetical protein